MSRTSALCSWAVTRGLKWQCWVVLCKLAHITPSTGSPELLSKHFWWHRDVLQVLGPVSISTSALLEVAKKPKTLWLLNAASKGLLTSWVSSKVLRVLDNLRSAANSSPLVENVKTPSCCRQPRRSCQKHTLAESWCVIWIRVVQMFL